MDVEIEKPHVHHHKSGLPWYDLVLPIAALFVSFVSIFIAWEHGQVMKELVHQNERLVEANSLPYLQLNGSDVSPTGEPRISLYVANQGVGPAQIRTAEMLVDNKPQPDFAAVLRACCGDPRKFSNPVTSTLLGDMIRPGERVNYLELRATRQNLASLIAVDKARQTRIVTRLCYCSVFGDCWFMTSTDEQPPRKVAQCAPVATMYRQ